MTLVSRANKALALLEADEDISASAEILERGLEVSSQFDAARDTLLRLQQLAEQLTANPLKLETKAATKSLIGLEQALTKRGLTAIQHQSTSNAVNEARMLQLNSEKWAASAWREALGDINPALARANSPELNGSHSDTLLISTAARRLERALRLNPLTDLQKLKEDYESDELSQIMARLRQQASELALAIDRLEAKHEAMPTSIRAALAQARSDEGLPLSDVTHELLDELRAAGVIDRLTVKTG